MSHFLEKINVIEISDASYPATTGILETIVGGIIEPGENTTLTTNFQDYPDAEFEYIFDRTDVRAIFFTLYSIVFCSCFFGKSPLSDKSGTLPSECL